MLLDKNKSFLFNPQTFLLNTATLLKIHRPCKINNEENIAIFLSLFLKKKFKFSNKMFFQTKKNLFW